MQQFTPTEYLKIELANQWGLDKLTWQERIDWAFTAPSSFNEAESPAQYYAAYVKYQEAMSGKPTNATVSLDCTCSGLQWISIITGCKQTAEISNVISSTVRNDAYTLIHEATQLPIISRKECKKAVMQTA